MLNNKYKSIRSHVLEKLKNGLSPLLVYHSVDHTVDVLNQAIRIAGEEGITNEEDLFLLKVATLYHDTGFLYIYTGHEEKSQEIARKELPQFGLSPQQMDKISGLIHATRIPQNPVNHLEQVLCDADLDYLGRDDFFPVANMLFQELLSYKMVANEQEWNHIQIKFLTAHHYFTATSVKIRSGKKAAHLAEIEKIVNGYAAH